MAWGAPVQEMLQDGQLESEELQDLARAVISRLTAE